MTLYYCIDCGKLISENADPCPIWGRKNPHNKDNNEIDGCGCLVIIILIIIAILIFG